MNICGPCSGIMMFQVLAIQATGCTQLIIHTILHALMGWPCYITTVKCPLTLTLSVARIPCEVCWIVSVISYRK